MESNLHTALCAMVLKLLRPLVRVLLNHGMAHDTFGELSRQVFVEEGFAHMARSGKRPTVSGVAALTGLNRKEVKRLNELDSDEASASSQRRNRAIRVISGWVNDTDFGEGGEPAVLPLEGEGASFHTLVKRYSGDITPVAMLSLLQDSGNVVLNGDQVTLLNKAYIPMATPLDRLNILGTDAAELIGTIGHNIVSEPSERLFQRKVSNALVHRDVLPQFRELSNRRSQELLEEYDAWLAEREVESQDSPDAAYVAVGIYYVEHTHSEELP